MKTIVWKNRTGMPVVKIAATAALLVLGTAGCETFRARRSGVDERGVSRLLSTEKEIKAFMGRARDPREYAITVTTGPDRETVFVNANRTRPGLYAVAPFISPADTVLPLIEGQIGSRGVRILIDPTSEANWTSIERAGAYRLTALGPPFVGAIPEHVVDMVRGEVCAAAFIQIDAVTIDAPLFYARASRGPLWPLSRSADAHDADFVMGWSLLRSFRFVRWDFESRVVVLSTRPYIVNAQREMSRIPLDSSINAMAVKGTVDGKSKLLLVDLAGDFDLAADEATMDLVRQVSFGDIVLRDLHPTSLLEQGLGYPGIPRLGLRALSRYSIVLDNHRNELIVEIPSSAAARPAAE